MIRNWFYAGDAVEVGTALADQFAPKTESASATRADKGAAQALPDKALQNLLRGVDRKVQTLRLNFFKRAKLANSFKWRLVENGVDRAIANELTQMLVLHLASKPSGPAPDHESAVVPTARSGSGDAKYLLTLGNDHFAKGEYAEAIVCYRDLIRSNPRHAEACNNLGAALCRLGSYKEAEDCFSDAIGIKPDYAEAHCNLGNVLRWRGLIPESEISLRRALELNPSYLDARANLGLTLIFLGRVRDAASRFKKVLKVAPGHIDALLGMAEVASVEGRFDEAEAMFKRVLKVNPKVPNAWAALAGLRKMKPSDSAWLEGAEEMAASGIAPLHEAIVRFAIGKYCDDVEDFKRAFDSYKRANELLKPLAGRYERSARAAFVDDVIRVYTREAVSRGGSSGSVSTKPVFVVGMMRSGTSLAEHIIASHPSAKGAGELPFWGDVVRKYEPSIRRGLLDEALRKELADAYLRILETYPDALRVVDKSPTNTGHLGVIHSVFPNARVIYMRRDPIDTCLSCYFQNFSLALNFALDLSDLAHYYQEHRRLIAHWRAVLPPGTILDVPYEGLVANPEEWTRKILDFLDLPWDDRCLDFHRTQRPVVTASSWQVRQKVYHNSVGRWRNYEKFIGPLSRLRESDS